MMKNKPKHLNLNNTTTLLLQNKGAKTEEHSTSPSWHSMSLQFTSVGCTGFVFTNTVPWSSEADLSTQHRWKPKKVFKFTQKLSTMHCCRFDALIYFLQSLLELCDSYLQSTMKYKNYTRSFPAWKSGKETQELQYFLVP